MPHLPLQLHFFPENREKDRTTPFSAALGDDRRLQAAQSCPGLPQGRNYSLNSGRRHEIAASSPYHDDQGPFREDSHQQSGSTGKWSWLVGASILHRLYCRRCNSAAPHKIAEWPRQPTLILSQKLEFIVFQFAGNDLLPTFWHNTPNS
jgi:hypothetical protein